VAALEITDRRDSDRQPEELFNPASRAYRSGATTRDLNHSAAPPVSDNVIEPSPSLTIRASNRQAVVEPPRQTVNVQVPQVSPVVDVTEDPRPRTKTPPAPREEVIAEARVEKIAARSAGPNHRAADEAAPTVLRPAPKRKKPQSSREDEEKDLAQPIRHRKHVIERELQTVTIREKPRLNEPERRTESNLPSSPTSGVTSPAVQQHDNSKEPPMFLQSRIAPLLEVARLNQSRVEPQPTVHVTIGRLEVRAVQTSQPAARPRAAAPVMNLDDYLKRRSQGGMR
jgi:hypothetical protein